MNASATPVVSIVMPVFNTGAFLSEAVDSVLNQQDAPDGTKPPPLELLVVDDHSTDPATVDILRRLPAIDDRVRVLANQRGKGASGARNTGIGHARGTWIGFIDSDDLWFPDALALRWQVVCDNQNAAWVAARFQLLKPLHQADADAPALFARADQLMQALPKPAGKPLSKVLQKPVAEFVDSCLIQTTTVLIRRSLILELGLFNEQLPRSEDYHLWFRCAFGNDLYLLETPVSFYRIHPASLTHGNKPRLLCEDAMVLLLTRDPVGSAHSKLLMKRFDISMQDQCYFYRRERAFSTALATSVRWVGKRPFKPAAWKEVAASLLRRS